MTEYRSYVVREVEKRNFRGTIEKKMIADLPAGELLIRVHYSSLNYKDALSASGNRGVTRRYPHTPGIDAVGEIIESNSTEHLPGDHVIASCFDLGMNHPGGFAEYIKVPASWVVKLPDELSAYEAMVYGTAGFTAGRCVDLLLKGGVKPEHGKVVVTGATGGVGSVAVAILAKLGFKVTALTGKVDSKLLRELGVDEIVDRNLFSTTSPKKLLKETWAGAVDTVGGAYLENVIKQTKYDGVVTSCGNAASADLNLSVYPFIIRGVKLIGVDSAECSKEVREPIWNYLATEWKIDRLHELAQTIKLEDLQGAMDMMLAGKLHGRKVINML